MTANIRALFEQEARISQLQREIILPSSKVDELAIQGADIYRDFVSDHRVKIALANLTR